MQSSTEDRRHRNINLILPLAYKNQLTEWAKKNEYSVTYVIRQAIKDFFSKKGIELP